MSGSESATFISKETATEYGLGNLLRFKVTGPHDDNFNPDNPRIYYVVGGPMKEDKDRKYYDVKPMFNGKLKERER